MICGGSDKGNDMNQMVPLILEKVKLLVLNGATADKIYEAVTSNENYAASGLKIKKPILCRMRLKSQKQFRSRRYRFTLPCMPRVRSV